MPYIDQDRRRALTENEAINRAEPQTAGDLTFIFAHLIDEYHAANGLSFEKIAEVLASLDAAAKEYYRRIVGPYEQVKAATHGDVFVKSSMLLREARPTIAPDPPDSQRGLARANLEAEAQAQAAKQTPEPTTPAPAGDVLPQESGRTLEKDGVQGIEGGGFGE